MKNKMYREDIYNFMSALSNDVITSNPDICQKIDYVDWSKSGFKKNLSSHQANS